MSDGKRSWAESAGRRAAGHPFDPFKDNHPGWHAGPPPVSSGGGGGRSSGGGGGCFVTTAAYGDAQHPMVQSFRGLRDEVLVNFRLGRAFASWYKNNGPVLARIIENNAALRASSRVLLTPMALAVNAFRRIIDGNTYLGRTFYNRDRQ